MPEKIDFFGLGRESLLHWLIITTMTEKSDGGIITDVWPKLDASGLEIKMTINGVEVPIVKSFDRIKDQLDRMIKEKANEIIKDTIKFKLDAVIDRLEDVEESFLDMINEVIQECGPKTFITEFF